MSPIAAAELRTPYATCPLCDCGDFDALGEVNCSDHPGWSAALGASIRWQACRGCGHVFTDGYWTDAALSLVFSRTHAHQTPGSEVELARRLSARIVERIATARGSFLGRWLDVGFGDGALLSTADEFGFEVLGLDLREDCVRRMREFGYRAERRALESLEPVESFEIISMCDVLEHLPFPKRALEHAAKLLAPNGTLLVSSPNLDSFAWKWLDRSGQNPYWRELEHFHNFGRDRLCALLVECGLEPFHYAVSERYRAGMEVLASKSGARMTS